LGGCANFIWPCDAFRYDRFPPKTASDVTRIDRYILVLFLRTVLICFCSLAGIFVVFHAFTSMDELVRQGQIEGGLPGVLVRFYGPYMLLLFDWTGAIIALMAFLFTVGWLRRTGELTSTLAAGVSHGRLMRPMIIASLAIVSVQMLSRELILPHHRDSLSMKAKDLTGSAEQSVKAKYDKVNRILVDATSMDGRNGVLNDPSFRLDGDYGKFGDLLLATNATWVEHHPKLPAGYLLEGVSRPLDVDTVPSVFWKKAPVLLTSKDQAWLTPGQAYFVTRVHPDLLQTSDSASRRAAIGELIARIKNPAIHSSLKLQVLLHERMVRPPLDFALILLGLPLVVNRKGRNLFVMMAVAMFTVMGFFAVKTAANYVGGSGYLVGPATAAWIPLLVCGPIAYVRYRDVQLV
jgi:lipopolysaccharide export system permease protein